MAENKRTQRNALHLWEFLLELLADKDCESLISWTHKDAGEFKLRNHEEVAKRWGALKRRPEMNYDKLSRALRYYYGKGIVKKVTGQRLVYKFVDLPYKYKPTIKCPPVVKKDKRKGDKKEAGEEHVPPMQTEITIKSEPYNSSGSSTTQKEPVSSHSGDTTQKIESTSKKRILSAAEQVIADVARKFSSNFVIPIYKIQCLATPIETSSAAKTIKE